MSLRAFDRISSAGAGSSRSMQFQRHFDQCFHIVGEDLEDALLRLGQPLRLVRHAAEFDEEIVCRTVPWGELEAAFDAGRGLLHQLIFVQIQSVLVFVLEIEIVVEVEVLVFLGAIIELGRDTVPPGASRPGPGPAAVPRPSEPCSFPGRRCTWSST